MTGGDPVPAAWIFHAVLGSLGTWFVFALARRYYSEKAGLAAAAIWAVYPPDLVHASQLMPEAVVPTLLLGAVWFFVTAGDGQLLFRSPIVRYFAAGALLAFCALMKPFLVPLCAAMVIAASLPGRDDGRGSNAMPADNAIPTDEAMPADDGPAWTRWRGEVAILLVSAAILAPWAVRNALVFGSPEISLNAGVNLWIGNNPEATGGWKLPAMSRHLLDEPDEAARDKRLTSMALRWIAGNPGEFLRLLPLKLAYFLSSEAPLAIRLHHRGGGGGGTTGGVRSAGSGSIGGAGTYRTKYMNTPASLHLMLTLPYAALVIAGIWGFALIGPRRPGLPVLTGAICGYWIVVSLIIFGNHRFHHPLMPFLVIGAAALLTEFRGKSGGSGQLRHMVQASRGRLPRVLLAAALSVIFLGTLGAELVTALR